MKTIEKQGKKDVIILNDLVNVNSDRIKEYERVIKTFDTESSNELVSKRQLYGKDRLGENHQFDDKPNSSDKVNSGKKEWGKNGEVVDILTKMISQSLEIKKDLQTNLESLGGEVHPSDSLPGATYKTWIGIRNTFSNYKNPSAIELCEYNEDALQATYDKALEDDELNSITRDLINKQKSELRDSYNLLKDLDHSPKVGHTL